MKWIHLKNIFLQKSNWKKLTVDAASELQKCSSSFRTIVVCCSDVNNDSIRFEKLKSSANTNLEFA